MPGSEEILARMKALYTYGKDLNESKNLTTHTLEHRAVAADGKTYGIVKECNKYYIKSATKGQETIAESYNYLGGFCNKGDYEYTSYANALKNFNLKMASINEACEARVNIDSLDPFRTNVVLAEATESMRNEIARQRQIMFNASMLMNEATEIGADRKNDVVKFDGKQPEAETGKKGDKATGSKDAKVVDQDKVAKTKGVNKKAAPFNTNSPKCADQLSEGCGCEGGECKCGENDWGSTGIGKGRDPKSIGWEIEGQQVVKEEEEDWASQGLPSTPGVGDADNSHNNDPFNKAVNEGDEFESADDVEDDNLGDDEEGFSVSDFDDEEGDTDTDLDTDFDAGVEDVDDVEGDDDSDLDDDLEDDSMDGLGDEGDMDNLDDEGDMDDLDAAMDADENDDDIMARIEELQAQIEDLKAMISGDNADEFDDDSMDDLGDEGDTDDFDDDSMDDMDDDSMEDFDDEDGMDNFDDEGDMDDDSMDDLDDEGDMDNLDDEDGMDNFDDEGDMDDEENGFDGDMDECGNAPMMEAKRAKMNSIIESVVNKILAEDELHDFGKHPGYRKKPMELPTTGDDKNQWGEDWNDESVHSEEPFGKQIGNGDPFNQMVDVITKDVMAKIAATKSGIPVKK